MKSYAQALGIQLDKKKSSNTERSTNITKNIEAKEAELPLLKEIKLLKDQVKLLKELLTEVCTTLIPEEKQRDKVLNKIDDIDDRQSKEKENIEIIDKVKEKANIIIEDSNETEKK